MEFFRAVKDSNDLAKVLDIPKGLRNRKVEVIIFPYKEPKGATESKSLRGALSKYKNEELRAMENGAWSKAVVDPNTESLNIES